MSKLIKPRTFGDWLKACVEWEPKIKWPKPCSILKFCPYGELVEEFPLGGPTQSEALFRHSHLKNILSTGKLSHNVPLDDFRRRLFQKEVSDFQEENYPEEHPEHILKAEHVVFGHQCPVFHCAEDVKEDIE